MVSVLFNEPKLLKFGLNIDVGGDDARFSALQRAEIAEIPSPTPTFTPDVAVSVLFNEPKLLKSDPPTASPAAPPVSVLFNEPKLLKCLGRDRSSVI